MSSYVTQIESINKELKRISVESKKLREKKKMVEYKLFQYMEKRNIDQVDGIKKKKVEPKEKVVRPKKKEKEQATRELFWKMGVQDPDLILEKLKEIQSGKNM